MFTVNQFLNFFKPDLPLYITICLVNPITLDQKDLFFKLSDFDIKNMDLEFFNSYVYDLRFFNVRNHLKIYSFSEV